jgi:hypothetical protein
LVARPYCLKADFFESGALPQIGSLSCGPGVPPLDKIAALIRILRCSKRQLYSMTSSARASSVGGISRPRRRLLFRMRHDMMMALMLVMNPHRLIEYSEQQPDCIHS